MYDITLIIPTHNRHKYLPRSIEYFSRLNVHILFCDSSEEPYQTEMPDVISYYHLPGLSFRQKVKEMLGTISTKYVVMCADDDFITYKGIYKSVEYLELNSKTNSVCGDTIYFGVGPFFYSTNRVKKYGRYHYFQGDPTSNVRHYFKNYTMLLWAVHRTEIMVKSFDMICNSGISNDNYIELIIGTVASYSGGIVKLPYIYKTREINQSDHWGKRHKNVIHQIQEGDDCDYKRYIDVIDAFSKIGIGELAVHSYKTFYDNYSLRPNSFTRVAKTLHNLLIKELPLNLLAKIASYRPGNREHNDGPSLYSDLAKIMSLIQQHDDN